MANVLTLGTFDLMHSGHLQLFQQGKKIAGTGSLMVAVNPDEFVEKFKGTAPVQSLKERVFAVGSCRWVDSVHETPGPDAKPLIKELKPDFILIGSDWATKGYHAQLQVTPEWLEEQGTTILYLDRYSFHSSTELKARIRDQSQS